MTNHRPGRSFSAGGVFSGPANGPNEETPQVEPPADQDSSPIDARDRFAGLRRRLAVDDGGGGA